MNVSRKIASVQSTSSLFMACYQRVYRPINLITAYLDYKASLMCSTA
jgi:hypothetical protein